MQQSSPADNVFETKSRRNMKIIGYARVSTAEQSVDMQVDALTEAGAEKIYVDHGVSGAKAARPQLTAALDYMREGDVLMVYKIDRLSRSLKNLVDLVSEVLVPRGIQLKSLNDSGLDTTTPQGIFILQLFGVLAEFERELIRGRTREGLKAARARGRKGGRPTALSQKQHAAVRSLYDAQQLTVREIAAQFSCSPDTIYRSLTRTAAPQQ